jgi:hypothetical protein
MGQSCTCDGHTEQQGEPEGPAVIMEERGRGVGGVALVFKVLDKFWISYPCTLSDLLPLFVLNLVSKQV